MASFVCECVAKVIAESSQPGRVLGYTLLARVGKHVRLVAVQQCCRLRHVVGRRANDTVRRSCKQWMRSMVSTANGGLALRD